MLTTPLMHLAGFFSSRTIDAERNFPAGKSLPSTCSASIIVLSVNALSSSAAANTTG
jgi:hypothetical protein